MHVASTCIGHGSKMLGVYDAHSAY